MTTLEETILDIFDVKNPEKIEREELLENLSYAGDVLQENIDEKIEKDKSIKLSEDVVYVVNADAWEEGGAIYIDIELTREDASVEDEDEAFKTVFTTEAPLEVLKISGSTKNADIISKIQAKIDELEAKFINLIKANK